MNKNSEKGAILALVLVVLVVFSLMGYGLLNQSAADRIEVVKNVKSNQAFWLAEAGIQRAIFNIYDPANWSKADQPLGSGVYSYDVSELSGGYRWEIVSDGKVLDTTRSIKVTIAHQGHKSFKTTDDDGINFNGTARPEEPYEDKVIFDLKSIFGGVGSGPEDVKARLLQIAMANGTYYESSSVPSHLVLNNTITYIRVTGGNWVYNGNISNPTSALLFIDGNVRMNGNINFNGIMYINGNLTMGGGSATTNGTILVDGQSTIGGGSGANINYNAENIADVYRLLNSEDPTFFTNQSFPLVTESWEEI